MQKRPRLFGALGGLLTGAPQGLTVHEVPLSGLENALPWLVAFGLLAPPFLVGLGLLTRESHSRRWADKINEYFDIFQYMVWGCLSLAAIGFCKLQFIPIVNPGAFAVVAFFAAGGVGFFIGSILDRKYSHSDTRAQQAIPADRPKTGSG